MRLPLTYLRHSLLTKLILSVGLTLLLAISFWAYYEIEYQKSKLMEEVVQGVDRQTTTIRLGTHYAMMLNSRDDINQIINNIGRQKEIENIRIYNKEGEIKYSNQPQEIDRKTNIKAEACYICHRTEPPLTTLEVEERIRIFSGGESRLLGIISPIRNDPGCSSDACHVHPEDKQILGLLDLVVSLKETDNEILFAEKRITGLAVLLFLLTSTILFVIVFKFVNRPVKRLIEGTRRIAQGRSDGRVDIGQDDEMGQLAEAVNRMGREIGEKQTELNRQRDEYQTLFERAPCMITVQDREYRLLRYNQEFARRFDTSVGDHCFQAYKGRDEKCGNCPVERTFIDGKPHYGEEAGVNKDGSTAHFIFRTSPMFDDNGQVVAAMEMSLDITRRRRLEKELEQSEHKYHEIFNNIPNPVFVLDFETLEILDCNESVSVDYGYETPEIIGSSFLNLFVDKNPAVYESQLRRRAVLNQVKHRGKDDRLLYVNIRVSPSEYPGKKVLLVTTSDITKRLEAEQQLIQASKMATLGEMATGIAHELNQPLSVIKTTSSYFIRKIDRQEAIDAEKLNRMLRKVDHNVDRATNIINHMRQFARKSEMSLEKISLNDVLKSAFEIFSQQLKVRGIEVVWELQPDLPRIEADPARLEQVFINLLLNARDAIEDKRAAGADPETVETIILKSWTDGRSVVAEVRDSGAGIPKEVEEKMFEPFFTTKEVGKGTGLGLSISYGIVKDCRGEIRAVSRGKNRGAVFYVTFPIGERQSDPTARGPRQRSAEPA